MRCVMNVGSQQCTFLWGCVDALCSSSTTRWWPFLLAKESAVSPLWWRIKLPDIRAITRTVLSMTDRYHTASHSWKLMSGTVLAVVFNQCSVFNYSMKKTEESLECLHFHYKTVGCTYWQWTHTHVCGVMEHNHLLCATKDILSFRRKCMQHI